MLLVTAGGACSFWDPLSQPGLSVTLSPPDTSLYMGAQFQARGLMRNRYGDQYPSDHLRYAGLDPAVSVERNGNVTGVAYGRAALFVDRDGLTATSWVSVVPAGTVALSRRSDQSRVDIVNLDGSGFVSLVSSGQFNGGAPAWLPGNAGLVYQYAVPGGGGATQLFVTDLAGNTRLLVSPGYGPRVARDGSWVYFNNSSQIWRVHVDGSALERLTVPMTPSRAEADPDPSPDGTQLAFIRGRVPNDGRSDLVVRDLPTGAERLLGSEGFRPRWAPSGNQLAFFSDAAPGATTGVIRVVGSDGTGASQVSAPGRRYRVNGLDWSPDGQWLLARGDSTLDLIEVATRLTLPLGFPIDYHLASWRW